MLFLLSPFFAQLPGWLFRIITQITSFPTLTFQWLLISWRTNQKLTRARKALHNLALDSNPDITSHSLVQATSATLTFFLLLDTSVSLCWSVLYLDLAEQASYSDLSLALLLEYDCPSMTLPLHVPAYSTTPFIFCTVLLLFDIILTIIFVYGFIFSLL